MLVLAATSVLALSGAFAAGPENAAVTPSAAPAAVALTASDVESWLDG